MNKQQVLKICEAFQLGSVLNDAIPVSGGLIHRMWRIDTSYGSFAIKELDAAIMARPGVHNSYIQSEKIAALLKRKKIPAVTALLINNLTPLYDIDGVIVMVFPWVKGKTLLVNEVTSQHATRIGMTLAAIHTANIQLPDASISETHIIPPLRWQTLIDEAIQNKLSWATTASKNLPDLIARSDAYQNAKQRLNQHLVMSHRDMDPKNVLWRDDNLPILIDWEGADLINPTEELVNVAMEWAGMTEVLFRDNIFSAVIEGYCKAGGSINESEMHDAFYGLIGGCQGWLEFNMCRSLPSSDYDIDTQRLGIKETELTLKKLHFLSKNIERFIDLLKK